MKDITDMGSCSLKIIPGVGDNIERHLQNIGIKSIADLQGKDPEALYVQDCLFKGFQEDKCLLYVFRLAVYFAENNVHEPEKLKWWYWKDQEYTALRNKKQQMQHDI